MRSRSEILLECFEKIPMETITTPAEVNRCLGIAADLGNLLFPVAAVSDLPQMRGVSFRFIFLDDDKAGPDVYFARSFCKGDNDRALTQEGILKLWKAAGGRDVKVERMDDRSDPNLAETQVTVGVTGLDGREETYTATRTVDLRPGSPEGKAMTERQLSMAQQKVDRDAESKARLRAIRKALALKQVYTVKQLSKPYIVPVLVAQFDESDPAMRRLLGAHALGIVDKVFGPASRTPAELPPVEGVSEEFPLTNADGSGLVSINTDAAKHPDAHGRVTVEAVAVATPDAEDVPAAPLTSADVACSCPCGCCVTLDDTDAKYSLAKIKTPRCKDCFPSVKTFNVEMHSAISALDIPDREHLTVEFLARAIAGAK